MTNYTIVVRNDDTGTEQDVASGQIADGDSAQHTIEVSNPSLVASSGNT